MRRGFFFILTFLFLYSISNAQNIGIFLDPDYIDIQPDEESDACEAEGLVVQQVLTNLGYNSFIAINDENDLPGILPGLDLLIIPEDEENSFAPTGAVLTSIQNFVSGGGKVIVMYSTSVLDDIFALNVGEGGDDDDDDDDDDDISIIPASATGTCYDSSGVTSLSFNNATSVLESMLPEGSICYYKSGDRAGVASIPYGSGSVCFLGWDWYYCDESDTEEEKNAWNTVLGCMIQEAGISVAPIPTMGQWALIVLSLCFTIIGVVSSKTWARI